MASESRLGRSLPKLNAPARAGEDKAMRIALELGADEQTMRAEMANFELSLRKSTLGDDWQVIQLDWQPAALGDFL